MKLHDDGRSTRDIIVRRGTEILAESGFLSTSIDRLLASADVPKGSFYYYFSSKEEFGLAAIDNYGAYFARKLSRLFENDILPPLDRLWAFAEEAKAAMVRFEFRRGCLLGNLGQEVVHLSEPMRDRISETFVDWERRLAALLREAVSGGALRPGFDAIQSAAFFWTGWEGAVLRARLVRSVEPLDLFLTTYLATLPTVSQENGDHP